MDIPRVKTIFLSIVILTSLFAFVTPFQNSFESSYTKSVSGTPTVTFRDISDTSATVDPIVSLDKSKYKIGETAIITVTDSNADVNIGGIDFATATVTMSSSTDVTLTETGSNTGVFTGTFTIDAAPSVDYTPDSPEAARAEVTLPLDSDGDVILSDYVFSNNEFNAVAFNATSGALNVALTNGASMDGTPKPTVKISFANANLPTGVTGLDLEMWHKSPGEGWELVTTSCATNLAVPPPIGPLGCPFFDNSAQTITSDPTGGGLVGETGEGLYVLGYTIGGAGGGGGGLVRPGLVVNVLAGASSLGGGSGPPGPTVTLSALAKYDSAVERISMPQEIRDIVSNHDPHTPLEPIVDTYEDFDLPFSINGNGFALGGYENTLVTQTIQPGEPTEFIVVYYTNSELAHSSLNFNSETVHGSDTQLLLFYDKPPELIDQNGNIESFTGSINNEGELKRVATFLATFSETAELPNPNMVIRSWTTSLSSGDTIVYGALEIAQPEIVEIADEDIPEPEIQTLKSQYVPIWIKNNAAWWSQELIADSDFVAGIEYLIQNEIITVQDNETIAASYSSNEIPEWIKNTAGWWSDDLITEKEFIDGLQWLISNGIVQVIET